MPQEIDCGIEILLVALALLFWRIAHTKFGRGVAMDDIGRAGSAGVGVHIFFGVITAILIAIVAYLNFK